jgi:predicted transcriptional regulator of viral defense system
MPAARPPGQKKLALKLLKRHGTMRLSDLMAHGIHPPTLARLVAQEVLAQPSRGLYELADAEVELNHGLAEIAKRVPRGVICLISALHFHQITLQMPSSVGVAIGARDRKPRIDRPSARFVRFGERALTSGVKIHVIDSVRVRIFDPAKTVVDCFRYRRTVGLDVSLEALRMALRSRKATPDAIARYARVLRIWSVLRPYLESTVADEG